MPQEAVSTHGIVFSRTELIYIDWDYFSRQATASVSFGVPGIGISRQGSLQELVYGKLTHGTIEKIERLIPAETGIHEIRLQSHLVIPEEELTTKMENEDCWVALCASQKPVSDETHCVPIMLKQNSVSYPPEFLPFLNSRLTFYGERKQVPVSIDGVNYDWALMARAIGFVGDEA